MIGRFDPKGRLIKSCGVVGCEGYPSRSDNANMRKKHAGDWWCGAHFKGREALKLREQKIEHSTPSPVVQSRQGRLI